VVLTTSGPFVRESRALSRNARCNSRSELALQSYYCVKRSELVVESSEQLLSRKALANRWGVCRETIKRAERVGLLRAIRFNERLLRYRLSDILAIEANGGRK
jgi:hypothetical protein